MTHSDETADRIATLGGGCFWCVEAVFQRLAGVSAVESGYAGGTVPHPTYKQVCTGTTGHAEVIQIRFDPTQISFDELLEVFWKTHDPTTPNRQGADVGTQYRSVIFHHDEEQKAIAERMKQALNDNDVFGAPVVTEIVPFDRYYKAEDYHQNFYNGNPNQPYCNAVIPPKLEKLREAFSDKLKQEDQAPKSR